MIKHGVSPRSGCVLQPRVLDSPHLSSCIGMSNTFYRSCQLFPIYMVVDGILTSERITKSFQGASLPLSTTTQTYNLPHKYQE